MRTLRKVLIVVVGLVALVSVIGFLLPRNIHIERSGPVSAAPNSVYMLLASPKIFNDWSPWSRMDPDIKIEYFGPASGIGAGYTWNSEVGGLGTGLWKIIGVEYGKQVNIELQFGSMAPALSKQIVAANGASTTMTWTLDSDLGFNPFDRWFGLFMDGLVGKDFEQGIKTLDSIARAKLTGRIDKIEQVANAPTYALTTRETVIPSQLPAFFARAYGGLIRANEADVTGAPFAIYHMWSKDSTDVEACIPISKLTPSSGTYTSRLLPGGPMVRASYFGPYEASEMAHNAVTAYIEKNKLQIVGSPWEVYITDPGTEPDPSKWLTYICYPVSSTTTP